MEKALMFLKHMKQTDTPYNFRECELDEAISELEEAMKPKTCEGCRYGAFGVDSFGLEVECTIAYRCSRGNDDMFKPKDNT
jgi:hypothetical protein